MNSNERPVWLLDVDGVINSYGNTPPTHVWRGQWEVRGRLGGFPFLTATPVLEFITRVHDEGLAEIRWHTTWQHNARLIEAEFGLPRFEVQDAPEFEELPSPPPAARWWKLPAAQRVVLEEGRRLVWTDDELAWRTARTGRALAAMRAAQPVLTVAPDQITGLTPRHLRKIESFLRSDLGHTTPATGMDTPRVTLYGVNNDDAEVRNGHSGAGRTGRVPAGSTAGAANSPGLPAGGTGAQGDRGLPGRRLPQRSPVRGAVVEGR